MQCQGYVFPRTHCPLPIPCRLHIILVTKADGSHCSCVDYKRLNEVTEKEHCPMSLMPDIVKMIAGAKIFSKLDLKDEFNQITVQPDHQRFTAFKCHKVVFEYRVMLFGLQNAPAFFQRMIDNVLSDLVGTFCVAYMDNILVFSYDSAQH